MFVPKGTSRRARCPRARRRTITNPPKADFGRLLARCHEVVCQCRSNRVVSRAFPHPYMMHMLGRGQWARQCSMRSDARVSGEYATKGLIGQRVVSNREYEEYLSPLKRRKSQPPPLLLSLVAISPSAAVWSIPHRGYCSSFLINYFRQKLLNKLPLPKSYFRQKLAKPIKNHFRQKTARFLRLHRERTEYI